MIECTNGMASLPEIVELEHIDMIIEGALGLSLSLGYGTQVPHQAVQEKTNKMS